MYKYHNLNPISQVGLDEFTKDYAPVSTPETADAILVRSAAMHEMEFAPDLKAIARAGAGVTIFRLRNVQNRESLYLTHREPMRMA